MQLQLVHIIWGLQIQSFRLPVEARNPNVHIKISTFKSRNSTLTTQTHIPNICWFEFSAI